VGFLLADLVSEQIKVETLQQLKRVITDNVSGGNKS
jgi:hypothetical protein